MPSGRLLPTDCRWKRHKRRTMKILALADVEEERLWSHWTPERTKDVDLIISCGDLRASYLEFLVTMTNVPLLYVCGNHDEAYDEEPPGGGVCIENRIYTHNGVRILGLGGSMRYRRGPHMYSEPEMSARVRRLHTALRKTGGIDILVTHAPPKGYGDLEDRAHSGFEAFNRLLMKHRPACLLHGHVHMNYGRVAREIRHPSGTRIINAYGHCEIEIPPVNGAGTDKPL